MRFSIVIPTYQRRETVRRMVGALDRQVHRDFEVIVVDDGSSDGTAAALRSLRVGFPLTVIEQGNLGAAQARNAGAAAATGAILLFLDDDMEGDPAMVQEHDRSHRAGADVVMGDLPLHPDSPQNVLSRGVGTWARRRRERLAAEGAEIPLADLLTGQVSIGRALFERLGRFDVTFTREGRYGGEDVDFGYRVLRAGCRVVFNPAAISFQYYDVDPADYLRRGYEAGRSEHELIVKHPERAEQLGRGPHLHTRPSRWLLGPFVVTPPALSQPLRATVAALVRSGRGGRRLRAALLAVRAMEYRRGARDARRALGAGRAVVLAYHAIADLSHDPRLYQYGVPAARLARQLDDLIARGWSFVDLDALLRAARGEQRLSSRSVLVTFDDAYADLLSAAAPVLAERGIAAVAFAVAGRIGETNEWDREIGAATLRLLDAAGLRALARHGVEIGSHGHAHRRLTPALAPEELAAELEGSADRLQALGLPRPRVLSYPYGVWCPVIANAVSRAGYEAAFTVRPGVVRRGVDRFALPRVEVLASDTPRKLRVKIATAGWPDRRRARALRLLRVRQ